MHSERVEFAGSQGDLLAGRLDLPDDQPRAFALFAHCFTCSKDVAAASRITQALTGFGIAVLRFDFTGLGGSDGDFANTNFTLNVVDLVNAADYLRDNHAAPRILVGHSLGGAAVLAAAEHVPETRAVATIGAPAGTEHLLPLLGEGRWEIEETGEAEICLAERPFRIRRQFLDDIADELQADTVNEIVPPHAPVPEPQRLELGHRWDCWDNSSNSNERPTRPSSASATARLYRATTRVTRSWAASTGALARVPRAEAPLDRGYWTPV